MYSVYWITTVRTCVEAEERLETIVVLERSDQFNHLGHRPPRTDSACHPLLQYAEGECTRLWKCSLIWGILGHGLVSPCCVST